MQITVNTRRERGIFDEGTSCNNNYRGWGRVRVARDECLRRLMARKEFDVVDTVFCLFFFLTSKTLSILLPNFYKNLRWSIKEGFGDFWNWDTCIWKIYYLDRGKNRASLSEFFAFRLYKGWLTSHDFWERSPQLVNKETRNLGRADSMCRLTNA